MLSRPANHGYKIISNVFCRKSPTENIFQFQSIPTLIKRLPYSCEKTDSASRNHFVFKPYKTPCYEDHDYKNMRLNRPMSPHLTIYAPTMTAMTSISQRISGMILALYATFLSVGALFLSNGVDTYVTYIQSLDLSSPLLFIIKLSLTVPFTYHYFNGMRFVGWSLGKWLSMKDIFETAKKAMILTGAFAFILALL